jgi:hypothetical protein
LAFGFLLTHDTKTFSIIPAAGNSKPEALYSSTFIKDEFHLSPDGQLIAYGENRAGGKFLWRRSRRFTTSLRFLEREAHSPAGAVTTGSSFSLILKER